MESEFKPTQMKLVSINDNLGSLCKFLLVDMAVRATRKSVAGQNWQGLWTTALRGSQPRKQLLFSAVIIRAAGRLIFVVVINRG